MYYSFQVFIDFSDSILQIGNPSAQRFSFSTKTLIHERSN